MRVAYVYDAVYPWEKGGAQKRVWEIARRMADDHDVHLYGMQYWDGPSVMEREGITFHGVCEPFDLYTDGRRSIPQAMKFAAAVTRPLLREEFDVVDCQQFPYFPLFTAKLHDMLGRSRLIATWYEVWGPYWNEYVGWKGYGGRLVERVSVDLPPHVIAISEAIRDDLRDIGRDRGVSVVPNGVDFDRLRAIEPVDMPYELAYVGRLSQHKHVDWLLDALAILADDLGRVPRTVVVGDGPEREALEAHAESVGVADAVDFLGFVEADDDVVANLATADAFVLPSVREGFPNTILEAAACGVPSIVVDAPENGSTAVVEDGVTGYVVDPGPQAIADAIRRIVTDEGKRERLSENAREFGRRHDWDVIVDRVTDTYSAVLTQSSR
ncbi:glycosyltransferase family 4 protein [Haloarchaeobius litoreus]|uniref:Glycosyltransferase family 4 protein n=1 Tax=Haloarchaeobius litoreus TaxID=755306 RepID=A0ABD6DPN0_9EURY|nr:glycosyltransferase family 4 protein [Haloarchaeobius litoreus]